MTGRKILALVFGLLLLLVGAALVSGATLVLAEDRDADGFYMTDEYTFQRSSYAIVSEDVDILTDAPAWVIDWITDPVDIKMRGRSGMGDDLFIGVAATSAVDEYLADVAHDEVTNIDFDGSTITGVEYVAHTGTTEPPTVPSAETFWEASSEGIRTRTFDWPLESGNWTVVVMNADASAGIDADLAFGVKVSNLLPIAWTVLGVGVIAVLGGALLIISGVRMPSMYEPPRRIVDLREEERLEAPPVEREPAVKA
jgi:hypothetical protein